MAKKKGYTECQKLVARLYNGLANGSLCEVDPRKAIPSGDTKKGDNRKKSPYIALCYAIAYGGDTGARGFIHYAYMAGGCHFTGVGGPIQVKKQNFCSESLPGICYTIPAHTRAKRGQGNGGIAGNLS